MEDFNYHYYTNPQLLKLHYFTDEMFSADGAFSDHRIKTIKIDASQQTQTRQHPHVPENVGLVIKPMKDEPQCVNLRHKDTIEFTVYLDIRLSNIQAVKNYVMSPEVQAYFPNGKPLEEWAVMEFQTANVDTGQVCTWRPSDKVLEMDGKAPVVMKIDDAYVKEMEDETRIINVVGRMHWGNCKYYPPRPTQAETCELRERRLAE